MMDLYMYVIIKDYIDKIESILLDERAQMNLRELFEYKAKTKSQHVKHIKEHIQYIFGTSSVKATHKDKYIYLLTIDNKDTLIVCSWDVMSLSVKLISIRGINRRK